MENASKMAEVLSRIVELRTSATEASEGQEKALKKLRAEKAALIEQQQEALENGDTDAYVSATKKIEDKQILIEYSEKRLQGLREKSGAGDGRVDCLEKELRIVAQNAAAEIDKRAIQTLDKLIEICGEMSSLIKAYSSGVTVLSTVSADPMLAYTTLDFIHKNNTLGLLHQRLVNAKKQLEADIARR